MAGQQNALRAWSVRMSRVFKDWLIGGVIPRRWFYAWLFKGEDGELRKPGEFVLADLRDFAKLNQVEIFHNDASVQAYRLGKQAVVRRIIYFLNLDERTVQKLMELDDE